MGALTDSLAAVETALTAAGIASVIKGYSTAAAPTTEHCVLQVEASPLERVDVDAYEGTTTVTCDWYKPGAADDDQADYLAAMDAWDVLIRALAAGLDRTCHNIDASGGFEKKAESDDLAHWYTGSVMLTFYRREPNV